jgi:hypothetical protein
MNALHWYVQEAAVIFPAEGVDGGSVSTLAVQVG